MRLDADTLAYVLSILSPMGIMLQLMYACKGVGLAAPQVGVNKRLMVFNPGTLTLHFALTRTS
jgi:peptide deformylase